MKEWNNLQIKAIAFEEIMQHISISARSYPYPPTAEEFVIWMYNIC